MSINPHLNFILNVIKKDNRYSLQAFIQLIDKFIH